MAQPIISYICHDDDEAGNAGAADITFCMEPQPSS